MNRDEQKQILGFIERALTGTIGVGLPDAGLPDIDPEADAIIRARFVRSPEAAYRITTLAMAMERELAVLRATVGAVAETPSARRAGWFFARRKAAAAPMAPQLPVMPVTTNG